LKKWAGYGTADEDEETVPPEAQQENSHELTASPTSAVKTPTGSVTRTPPSIFYVEKGSEFVGAQQTLLNSLAKAMGAQQAKAAGKTIPPG